ncbi:phosphotransferase family protein [Hyphomonas johnsonii]|uniref:Aminoglycoside phosphotransferase n=1 Tax=Hyphomonas johnsonii MHS-2 TaxID=1280950 RepID=A0A059FN89_9PROT|nr:phosphotransferase family protein [Hyphomonas johnsonii]KCZ92145.1 aminoglycoside phosphotransferase [Hyphomonas johnsonii MHS-2]
MDAEQLGSDIVQSQRAARFADTTADQWAERLTALIKAQPGTSGPVAVTNVRPVGTAAGGSNGTMLFDASYSESGARQDRALVLRFLPAEGLFHKYDVEGQYALQRELGKAGFPVPEQLWLDSAGDHLKVPGYVMEQVAGNGPPMVWKASGLIAEASPPSRRKMTTSYVAHLAKLHAIDWQAAGLDWLANRAAGANPVEREANWYWDALKWADFEDTVAMFAPVRDWLIAKEPANIDVVLCHGDINLGNYLFKNDAVSAVLDWEMAFLGTPECDLAMINVGDAALQGHVPTPEGALTNAEICAEYERITNRKLRHMDYFELFGSYRATIITTLAMKHYPAAMTDAMRPLYESTLKMCFDRARALGAVAGEV